MIKKIALVEDDPGIIEVTKIILEEEGYQVIAFDNSHHIKRFIQKQQPDLILMDIWIADQNGAELVKDLKSNPKLKKIPIVMVSAKQDAEKIAKDCGAQDFLAKPFEIIDLIEKVKKYI